MSNNNKYIGLTIGPIFETISQVKATRELWAASYAFSHLMEKIAQGLQQEGANLKMPFVAEKSPKGAGLYPDRLIYPENGVDIGTGKQVAREVLDGFAVRVHLGYEEVNKFNKLGGALPELESIKKQFKKYFRTYLIESNVDAGKNLRRLSDHLDTIEQYPQFDAQPHRNYFVELLGHLKENKKMADRVLTVLFSEEDLIIPSMGEIATAGLPGLLDDKGKKDYEDVLEKWKREEESTEPDDDLMQRLKGEKTIAESFRSYHKYVAVVQADGDNIGATIGSLEWIDGGLEAFSKGLFEIGEESVRIIKEYGGMPVYAGGDDLLFFAPVCHPGQEKGTFLSVFHLIAKLEKKFRKKFTTLFDEWEEQFKGFKRPENTPTLSFGVSINYYKFPMAEAIERSYELMTYNAKKQPGKNSVAVELLLASGTGIGKTFSLKRKISATSGRPVATTFSVFSNLMSENVAKEGDYLSSVTYLMERNKPLFRLMKGSRARVDNFFENSLDEQDHEGAEKYFEKIKKLIRVAYQRPIINEAFKEVKTPEQLEKAKLANQQAINDIYGVLRLIQFLKRKDHD